MLKKIPISAGNHAGTRRFSLIPVSRRVFAALFALCALLTLAPPGYAANSSLSMDKCLRSEAVYTPGDFAAARLAVYGILDDRFRTPQGETGQPIPRPDAVRLLWKAFDKSRKTETPPQSKKNGYGGLPTKPDGQRSQRFGSPVHRRAFRLCQRHSMGV